MYAYDPQYFVFDVLTFSYTSGFFPRTYRLCIPSDRDGLEK